jgi:predicted nucleotidyltransferase
MPAIEPHDADDRGRGDETSSPRITDELLCEVVRRSRAVGDPLKIVLFGSHARGQAGPQSDLDLLIVGESDLPRHRRAARYRRALTGLHPSKDIVVRTPAEIAEWAEVPMAFVTTALSQGRVLFGRPSARPPDPPEGP